MDRYFAFLRRIFLVEEVVIIVLGDGDIDEGQLAHRTMAATGLDEYGGHRLDGDHLAIQFQKALALEDEINFGGFLVVVAGGLILDFEEMDGGGRIRQIGKAPTGDAAAAFDFRQLVELDFVEAWLGHVGNLVLVFQPRRTRSSRRDKVLIPRDKKEHQSLVSLVLFVVNFFNRT